MNSSDSERGQGRKKKAKLAANIIPVRKNGNLLLCTLLLGNVAVNALLSIIMADFAGGLAGFLGGRAAYDDANRVGAVDGGDARIVEEGVLAYGVHGVELARLCVYACMHI